MALDPTDEAVEDEDTAAGTPPPLASGGWPDDDDPLPDGWADVDLSPAPRRTEIDWAALEVAAARVLPGGLVLAGRTEQVRIPLLGARVLPASLATGARRSRLHGALAEDEEGVTIDIGGAQIGVHPRREGGDLVVDAEVQLGGRRLSAVFVLDPEPADPAVVLGADDLGGHVVVDPAAEHRLGPPR
jgi:hypothetical protein